MTKFSAIHPCFALSYRDVEDFVSEYGPHKWRFAVDLADEDSSTWQESFVKWSANFSDIERKKIEDLRAGGRFRGTVLRDAKYAGEGKWVSAVADGAEVFELIVRHALADQGHMSWSEALSLIRSPDRECHSFDLPMARMSIVKELKYIFMQRSPIYLVDPFFSPIIERGEQRDLAMDLFRNTQLFNCQELHFISRDVFSCGNSSGDEDIRKRLTELGIKNHSDYQRLFFEIFSPLKKGGARVFSHLVNDSRRGDKFLDLHIRYAFNKYGGLEFDKGFSSPKSRQTQPVKAIARRYLQESVLPNYLDHVVFFFLNYAVKKAQKRPVNVTSFEV